MDEQIAQVRQMPNSREAEQSVIGCMIADNEAIEAAMEVLTKDDFYQKQYGSLFQAIVDLYNNNIPIDVVTIQDKLREMGVPETVASTEFLINIVDAVPVTVNAKSYAEIVREKAILRQIIRTNQEMENKCYAAADPTDTILEELEHNVYTLIQKKGVSDYVPIRDVVVETIKEISRASRTKGNVTGIPTGFTDLDWQTAGMHGSELILIAARPAMGKTAFALNIAMYAALKADTSVALFSLEMPKEQLVKRLLSLESGVDAQKLRTGNLQGSEWDDITQAAGMIGGSKLILDAPSGLTFPELRSKCRKFKTEQNLGLIVIDYLQLMTGSGKTESRQQEIAEISRSLKMLARELDVPVVALSQLSRAVEARPDKRPMLSDLRESGAIEQDADVVMFLYRDDYYNHDSDEKGIAEVIVAKQRSGPVGTVKLAWLPEYTKFANRERDFKEP